jgi:hypothetical protein
MEGDSLTLGSEKGLETHLMRKRGDNLLNKLHYLKRSEDIVPILYAHGHRTRDPSARQRTGDAGPP